MGRVREGEGGEGGRHAPLPPKCYETHTCTSGQRNREGREGGRREEGGVHRHKLNV